VEKLHSSGAGYAQVQPSRVRRFGTWAHWSPLFKPSKISNFKVLKKIKKNVWT
jgi:hypothetical protein